MSRYDRGELLATKVGKSIFEQINESIESLADESEATDEHRYSFTLTGMNGTYQMIKELYETNDVFKLAKLFEAMGVFDMNLTIHGFKSAVSLQCSSCFYYKADMKDEAKLAAKRNHLGFSKEYKKLYGHLDQLTLNNYKDDKTDQRIAEMTDSVLHLELLGDMCWFFDHDLANQYHSMARSKIKIIDQIDRAEKYYATFQYDWSFSIDLYESALEYCYGLDLSHIAKEDFTARIDAKEPLMERIR